MLHIELTSSWVLRSVALLLIMYTTYRLIRQMQDTYYPKTIKIILSLLRSLALLLFVIIVADMSITLIRDRQAKPQIAFLWDDSESMIRADSSYHPKELLHADAYKKLKKQTRITHIAGMPQPEIISEQRLMQRSLDAQLSDNGALLRFAESRMKFNELVLIGDGHSYLGEPLDRIKLRNGIKVHTIKVGEESHGLSPILRSVRLPDYVTQGDSINISWVLRNPGSQEISTEIYLMRENEEAFRKLVNIPPERLIRLQHTLAPAMQGKLELSWFADKGDKIASETITIHPSKIRVLCHADPPDRDVAMISNVLAKNSRYETYTLENWQKMFPRSGPDLTVGIYNADEEGALYPDAPAILFCRERDRPYPYFSEYKINMIKPYVSFSADPGLNAFYWTQLPPVQMTNMETQGTAIVSNIKGWPLILEQTAKRRIIVNGAGLWRWNLAGFEKDWDGLYEHLINGMAEHLIKQKDQSYISLDREVYTGVAYQTLPVETEIFHLDHIDPAHSFVRVTLMDSSFEEIHRYENDLSEHTGSFQPDKKGTYHIKADIFNHGRILESDTALVRIDTNDLESSMRDPNPKAMEDLADHHEGTYQRFSDPDSLRFSVSTKKLWVQNTSVFKARFSYWLYALMFLLMCADWIIRKRYGGI